MNLTEVQQKFILHWGEMGTKWGINRTVAQIHALLFINPDPINAEEIAETLSIARSNVSTSLRELQGWGLVKVSHRLGDRRDYFETLEDVWEMYKVVMDQRKQREVDPTTVMLRECHAQSKSSETSDPYTQKRLGEMLEFVETMSLWYDQVSALPQSAFIRAAKVGSKVGRMFGLGAESKKKGA